MLTLVGILFLVAGIVGIIYRDSLKYLAVEDNVAGNVTKENHTNDLSDTPKNNNSDEPNPHRVLIAELGIDVKVINGYYDNKTKEWTLSKDKAQFATITQKPNTTNGNTFIYGHAKKSVFGKLASTRVGTIANVVTADNRIYVYKYKYSYTVAPEDSSLFSYIGPPILTLQTCSGFYDQHRTMYVFELIGVKNA